MDNKPLTNEKYIELIKEYHNGNLEAKESIFTNSHTLIYNIVANKLPNSNFDFPLLFRIAKQGMFDAIDNYNIASNSDFRSFAIRCIINKLDYFLKNNYIPSIEPNDKNTIDNIINDLYSNFKITLTDKDYLEIRYIIEMLSSKVKYLLTLKYKNNLNNKEISIKMNVNESSVNEYLAKLKAILTEKINQLDLVKEPILETKIKRKRGRKSTIKENFIDNFPGHSIDELNIVIAKLPKKQQELTFKMFGYNLDTYNELNSKDKKNIRQTVIKNINLLLEGKKINNKVGRIGKTIDKHFPNNTIDEIKRAISKLPTNEQIIVYNIYGKNLDTFNKDVSDNDKYKYYQTIKSHIKLLIDGKAINNKSGRIGKTIDKYFPNNTIDEIRNAILQLPTYEQEDVYNIFGQNLDIFNFNASKKDKKRFYTTIKSNINLLLQGKKLSTLKRRALLITEHFPNNSLEEIKNAILQLPTYEQINVYNVFGQNLDIFNYNASKDEKDRFYKTIKSHINLLLEGKKLPTLKRKNLLITEHFPNNTLEEIKAVIPKLSLKDQEIIYIIFGQNLIEFNKKSSYKDRKRFTRNIKPNIELLLKGEKITTNNLGNLLPTYFPEYSIDELILAIKELPKEEQAITFSIYGTKLDEYNRTGKNSLFHYNIKPKIKTRLVRNRKKENTINTNNSHSNLPTTKIESIEKQPEVNNAKPIVIPISPEDSNEPIMTNSPIKKTNTEPFSISYNTIANLIVNIRNKYQDFTTKDLLIFILRIICFEEGTNLNNLCEKFNLTEDEINEISLNILTKMKDNFDEFYNSIVQSIKQKEEKDKGYGLKPKQN